MNNVLAFEKKHSATFNYQFSALERIPVVLEWLLEVIQA